MQSHYNDEVLMDLWMYPMSSRHKIAREMILVIKIGPRSRSYLNSHHLWCPAVWGLVCHGKNAQHTQTVEGDGSHQSGLLSGV